MCWPHERKDANFSHQMLLDLGGGEEGAGDGGAAVEVVAAQNGGVVSSRNLKQQCEDNLTFN